MSLNKNALIRYKTIDKCLQNKYRKWTLNNLIDACSDALNEYEGKQVNVSKRSIQLDIQFMRSDKLGYNAPIIVYDRKFYKYDDENYSITDIPITENDMNVLSETVEMLKQFKDFSLFSELGSIIHRLEDKVYAEKSDQAPIIHLDKNENLKGLTYLDVLYQAILKKIVLKINYQSFKARSSSNINIHPYLLKEFNNRWFLLGKSHQKKRILTLALDRINKIDYELSIDYLDKEINGDEYYKNTIGVTVMNDNQLKNVIFKADKYNAPYIITKPFHHSQEIIDQDKNTTTFKICVHLNFELERLILGFGDGLVILKPLQLRNRILNKLKRGLLNYQD